MNDATQRPAWAGDDTTEPFALGERALDCTGRLVASTTRECPMAPRS